MNQKTIDRGNLGACLLAAGRDRVLDTAHTVSEGLSVFPLQSAENGLALMQWRDAVMHQPFYLGEVPLSRAAVAVTAGGGPRVHGAAVIMADDAKLAQALALLDAIWAHRLPGAEVIDVLAESGAHVRGRIRAERQAMLKRTRVDFALLSETDDEDEE